MKNVNVLVFENYFIQLSIPKSTRDALSLPIIFGCQQYLTIGTISANLVSLSGLLGGSLYLNNIICGESLYDL